MRIPQLAVPSAGGSLLRSIPESAGRSPALAAASLDEFLSNGQRTVALSGAGISVDSNIPDYRGPSGTYTLNNNYRPIFFHEFVTRDKARRRYWARSFLGYPPVQRAKPNFTHRALAKLSIEGVIKQHITQNVDGLLHGAFKSMGSFADKQLDSFILELHGSLRYVICLFCHHKTPRTYIQSELERLNPCWVRLLDLKEGDLKTNADGDVDLGASSLGTDEAFEYRSFRYPPCPLCLSRYGDSEELRVDKDGAWVGGSGGIIKPAVTFFGENISDEVCYRVHDIVEGSDQVLIVGTTLAVLSAQRLVRMAKAQGKRIAIMTSGYVRNEEALIHNNDVRIWWRSSEVFEHIPLLSSLRSIPL